ncbi:hypothetical protein C8R41DRAFT_805992 [Lentinula lateritia]|uniref:Uncharacterized protein n=1 Tax=Lentinula lateritia TaxID=40482 RepID=A0ABQ8VZR4_9AGAR|nr:hypothetical protein C8R41DRAFT_805992 [Lentinula lateritia]
MSAFVDCWCGACLLNVTNHLFVNVLIAALLRIVMPQCNYFAIIVLMYVSRVIRSICSCSVFWFEVIEAVVP